MDLDYHISTLRQMRNHPSSENKLFVVVEGFDDDIFYRRFFDTSRTKFYYTSNCDIVVNVITRLNSEILFEKHIIGIKDSDYDYFLGIHYDDIPNLFVTDFHDHEMTALCEEFDNALFAEFETDLFDNFSESVALDIRNLSIIRWYNEKKRIREGLRGINFGGTSLAKIYDGNRPVELEDCLDKIKNSCDNLNLTHYPNVDDVRTFLRQEGDYLKDANWKHFTRGHDFVNAILIKMQQISPYRKNFSYVTLCVLLRNSCSFQQFKNTHLYRDINSWMESNGFCYWKTA